MIEPVMTCGVVYPLSRVPVQELHQAFYRARWLMIAQQNEDGWTCEIYTMRGPAFVQGAPDMLSAIGECVALAAGPHAQA